MTNQINTINLDNVQELLNFGNEAMEQMREITNNISSKLDTQITNVDIIPSINKVMKVIDYDELNKLNQKANNKFLKVIGMATQAKEKIFNKYALVIKNIDTMYFGVNAYKNNVISSTTILTELKENTIKLKETLNNQINFGYEILKSITENDKNSTEKKNILTQKIQDLQYSIAVSEQTINNIDVMLMTNYDIVKKLSSVYNTTIPIIQSQLNVFRVLKEQEEIISSLKFLDEKRNEILKNSAKYTVQTAKSAVESLGYTKSDFEVINNTINELKQGLNDIQTLQQQRQQDIQNLSKEVINYE